MNSLDNLLVIKNMNKNKNKNSIKSNIIPKNDFYYDNGISRLISAYDSNNTNNNTLDNKRIDNINEYFVNFRSENTEESFGTTLENRIHELKININKGNYDKSSKFLPKPFPFRLPKNNYLNTDSEVNISNFNTVTNTNRRSNKSHQNNNYNNILLSDSNSDENLSEDIFNNFKELHKIHKIIKIRKTNLEKRISERKKENSYIIGGVYPLTNKLINLPQIEKNNNQNIPDKHEEFKIIKNPLIIANILNHNPPINKMKFSNNNVSHNIKKNKINIRERKLKENPNKISSSINVINSIQDIKMKKVLQNFQKISIF